MDFTFNKYQTLLQTLHSQGFFFYTVREYFEDKASNTPFIMLRHDVEARYENALQFAWIQHEMGIKGTYYFRIYPKPGNEEIIKEIASLGHEIGYHYDDLSACKGNFEKAYERFNKNLSYLRQFAEVKTMTMEGAPLSKYDNRDLWPQKIKNQQSTIVNRQSTGNSLRQAQGDSQKLPPKACMYIPSNPPSNSNSNPQTPNPQPLTPEEKRSEVGGRMSEADGNTRENLCKSVESVVNDLKQYDYHQLGIIAEPYFDLDFNEIFYITDTGRRWDGHLFNIRDKATKENPVTNPEFLKLRFHSTQDLIDAINRRGAIEKANQPIKSEQLAHNTKHGTPNTEQRTRNNEQIFPSKAMLNFHPQRWSDALVPWMKELVWQNVKNVGKRVLLKVRSM